MAAHIVNDFNLRVAHDGPVGGSGLLGVANFGEMDCKGSLGVEFFEFTYLSKLGKPDPNFGHQHFGRRDIFHKNRVFPLFVQLVPLFAQQALLFSSRGVLYSFLKRLLSVVVLLGRLLHQQLGVYGSELRGSQTLLLLHFLDLQLLLRIRMALQHLPKGLLLKLDLLFQFLVVWALTLLLLHLLNFRLQEKNVLNNLRLLLDGRRQLELVLTAWALSQRVEFQSLAARRVLLLRAGTRVSLTAYGLVHRLAVPTSASRPPLSFVRLASPAFSPLDWYLG